MAKGNDKTIVTIFRLVNNSHRHDIYRKKMIKSCCKVWLLKRREREPKMKSSYSLKFTRLVDHAGARSGPPLPPLLDPPLIHLPPLRCGYLKGREREPKMKSSYSLECTRLVDHAGAGGGPPPPLWIRH